MKKTICALLLLSLCAALLLAGCSKPTPVGSWTSEVRFEEYAKQLDALSAGLSEQLDLSGLKLDLKLDLAEDNTFNLYTEQASLDQLLRDLRTPVEEAASKLMQKTYDLTPSELKDRLTELGLTLDGLVDDFFVELKGIEKPARITGTWRWEEGFLVLTGKDGTETRYAAELADGKLTVREADGEDAFGLGSLLPLVFQK